MKENLVVNVFTGADHRKIDYTAMLLDTHGDSVTVMRVDTGEIKNPPTSLVRARFSDGGHLMHIYMETSGREYALSSILQLVKK